MIEKFVYHFLITTNPTPTAPRIMRTPTGEAGAGVAVALGHGVGTFTVDFAVVFTVVTVVLGAVTVAVVTSGARTSEALIEVVFPAVTTTFCDQSL